MRVLAERMAKSYAMPSGERELACDDTRFSGLDAPARRLGIVVHDARFEPKNLLPLELTQSLTQPDLHALRTELELLGPTQAPSAGLLAQVKALEQTKFVAVFHVTEWLGAERVFRLDRNRWEWVAGTLVGRLAIHDVASTDVVCHTLVVVKNDIEGAPLAARLKSDTRERLLRELGRDARRQSSRALARISPRLELGGSEPESSLATR